MQVDPCTASEFLLLFSQLLTGLHPLHFCHEGLERELDPLALELECEVVCFVRAVSSAHTDRDMGFLLLQIFPALLPVLRLKSVPSFDYPSALMPKTSLLEPP